MSNVLFVMKYPTQMNYNLKVKFNGQIEAVRDLGHNADFIKWDGKRFLLDSSGEDDIPILETLKVSEERYFHTLYFVDLMKAVKVVCDLKKYDVIYIRTMPLLQNYSSLFRMLKKQGTKIVWEIPTYPVNEVPINWIRGLAIKYSQYNFQRICKYLDCFTAIGENIPQKLYGKDVIEIENGVGVSGFKKKQQLNVNSDAINIIGVAAMSYWQGFDRMITSIAKSKRKDVILHLVGPDGDGSLKEYRELASKLNVEENVIFHGPMYGTELDDIFDRCDLGLGALGMYRKNISVASTLKVTEYMARGIPFIYGYDDSRLEGKYDFCYKVDNDDSILDVTKIVAFAEAVRGNVNLVTEMRDYVRNNMSWKIQFDKIFNFLDI